MRRSLAVIVLVPVLLVTGIWLGGHPSVLPSAVRDQLVDDGDAQVYEEAVDIIKRDYYRNVDRDQLLDKSLGAAVKSLDDQFSNYFSPKDYADFQEVTQGQFSGVGMTVEETKQGPARDDRLRRLAGRPRAGWSPVTSSSPSTAARSPATPRRPRPRRSRASPAPR